MGPKYEFTGETMNYDDYILHRIRRLSDSKLGGWIESEENLSQEGYCWVYDDAKVYGKAVVRGDADVYGNARVYGNAKVYGDAKISDNAHVFGEAKVYDYASVYDDAQVYGNASIWGEAIVYGEAQVYDNAEVYGDAEVYGHALVHCDAKVYGNMKINSGEYTNGKFSCDEDNNETKKVVQDFIYKVDDSNKLTIQTEYDSVNEFFDTLVTNDVKLDTLIICTVDTKEPLIKLQKVEVKDKIEFKFIVEITNEDNDDFIVRSTIKSQDQLNQLIQQTIEALKQFTQFNKYADDLEEYL